MLHGVRERLPLQDRAVDALGVGEGDRCVAARERAGARGVVLEEARHILHQAAARAERVRDEHGREIASTAAEERDSAASIDAEEAGNHDDRVPAKERAQRRVVDRHGARVGRGPLDAQADLARIGRNRVDSRAIAAKPEMRGTHRLARRDERGGRMRRRVVPVRRRSGDEAIGRVADRAHDGDDGPALAHPAVALVHRGGDVVFAREHRAAELEHDRAALVRMGRESRDFSRHSSPPPPPSARPHIQHRVRHRARCRARRRCRRPDPPGLQVRSKAARAPA